MKNLYLALLICLLPFSSLASGSTIVGDSTLCAGTSTTFSDSISGGVWSSSDTAIASITNVGVVHGKTVGTATITYTTGSGYTTKQVRVKRKPSEIFGAIPYGMNSYIMCERSTVVLYDTTPGGGTWSYSSSMSDPELMGATSNSAVMRSVSNYCGSGNLTFRDLGGCSTSIRIGCYALPFPEVTGDTLLAVGDTTQLSPHMPEARWESTDTSVATVNTYTGVIMARSPGTTVITYRYGCSNSALLRVVWRSGVTVLANGYGVDAFPNPVSSDLTIVSTDRISNLTVMNLQGQILFACDYNSNETQIDVSQLPVGFYLLRINHTEVRKFIKQ